MDDDLAMKCESNFCVAIFLSSVGMAPAKKSKCDVALSSVMMHWQLDLSCDPESLKVESKTMTDPFFGCYFFHKDDKTKGKLKL